MNTEEVLFKTLNEIVLLSALYPSLSEEQVVTIIETVNSWFSELPPDVIERYREFLKNATDGEKARAAFARASILDDHAVALGLDEV
jgi:hypothetical protein